MKTSKVVYMTVVRELLAELDKVRADILAGEVKGWGGSITYMDGREIVYLGGSFKEDSASRSRAMLKVSAFRALKDDPPPGRRAG